MRVTIDPGQIAAMKAAIENTGRNLRKELAVACNATAAKGKSLIAKQIGKELATPQKNIRATISQTRKAKDTDISATLEVRKDRRISLKEFGARQTKAGVSYKISKTRGRKSIKSAFVVNSLGGHVFVREGAKVKASKGRYAGKMRQPIYKKYGPSSWGVFVVGKKQGPSVTEIEAELKKQIDRRIRFIALKASGTI